MSDIKNTLIFLILVIVPISLFGQEDICVCCSYNALQYQKDYDEIFKPSLIKSHGIKEVMVYTEPKNNLDSLQLMKYREIKFKFNKNGLVISKTHYNRIGKPHSIYSLKRNKYGKITQQTFNYIDSLEQKETFFGEEIIDYTYDNRKKLIKIKERGSKGKILNDNDAVFTLFKYDNEKRIKIIENYRNYGDESSVSITKYTYFNDSLSSRSKTLRDGILSASSNNTYDKNWKETRRILFNEALNSSSFDYTFQYDEKERLIKFQSISGPGSADECPENNTFIDTYIYDDDGFITSINHIFKNNICEMTFEYRK